jgi:hypothetical protein
VKGTLIIIVLLALLVGGYLVYRNLSAHAPKAGDAGRIDAIHRAKDAADQAQRLQEQLRKKAEDASR